MAVLLHRRMVKALIVILMRGHNLIVNPDFLPSPIALPDITVMADWA